MFNSKEYEWANIEVLMLGRPIGGLRGIRYKSSQEKEVIYGRGNKPRAVQKGNKAYEGSISLLQSELEALVQAAGKGKDVLDIPPFNIVVSYIPDATVGIVVTDVIENVEFTESEKAIKQGDKFMEIELPFIALNVDKNV